MQSIASRLPTTLSRALLPRRTCTRPAIVSLASPTDAFDNIEMGKSKLMPKFEVSERPVKVFFGGISWDTPVDTATSMMASALQAAGISDYERIEFALFGAGDKLSKRDVGKNHRGHGWIHFVLPPDHDPEALVARLSPVVVPGVELRWGLAKVQPKPKEEIEALKQYEINREKQREHKRRNKLRKIQRRIARLEGVIGNIEQRMGVPVRSLYGSVDEVPAAAAADRVATSAAASTSTSTPSIIWADMPAVLDPANAYYKPIKDIRAAAESEEAAAPAAGADDSLPEGEAGPGAEVDVDRGLRKRWQVESFHRVLGGLLALMARQGRIKGARPLVVDFGCGTGALTLCLAHLFPSCDFVGIDANAVSIDRMRDKITAAGLTNVQAQVGWIQEAMQDADVVLALHACGAASDFSLLQAARTSSSFAVCPCCVGKLKFALSAQARTAGASARAAASASAAAAGDALSDEDEGEGAPGAAEAPASTRFKTKDQIYFSSGTSVVGEVEHPRSSWMRAILGDSAVEDYSLIARAGDISHSETQTEGDGADSIEHTHPQIAFACKILLEADRVASMRERGFHSVLVRAENSERFSKGDLLVGWPETLGAPPKSLWSLELRPPVPRQVPEPQGEGEKDGGAS